jgi:hypothetical protein
VVDLSKTADGAAVVTWAAYFISHIAAANDILQFVALIVAIASGIYACRYHAKRIRQIDANVD